MSRLVHFFKARSFAILLFHVGVLLFSWPLLSLPFGASDTSMFTYLIIAWAVVVCVLIVIGQSIKTSEESRED